MKKVFLKKCFIQNWTKYFLENLNHLQYAKHLSGTFEKFNKIFKKFDDIWNKKKLTKILIEFISNLTKNESSNFQFQNKSELVYQNFPLNFPHQTY